jgi:hypothetical protein
MRRPWLLVVAVGVSSAVVALLAVSLLGRSKEHGGRRTADRESAKRAALPGWAPPLALSTSGVEGAVQSPTGLVVGATVTITAVDSRGPDRWRAPAVVVRTDAKGRFAAPGLSPGMYTVVAAMAGWAPARIDGLIVERDLLRVLLSLSAKGVTLRGHILDEGGGSLDAGLIRRVPTGLAQERAGSAAAVVHGGDYEIGLPIGTNELVVEADGYASERVTLELSTDQAYDFKLRPAGVLHGRVLRGGEPVVGAVVRAFRDGDKAVFAATTSEGGTFEIRRLRSGLFHAVARHGQDLSDVSAASLVRPGQRTGLELRLAPGLTVKGRVWDETRAPIPGARVSAQPGAGDAIARVDATADAAGRFSISGVPRGELWVTATAADFASAARKIHPETGAEQSTVDIVLSRAIALVMRVSDGNGPVQGATVTVSARLGPDWIDRVAVTDLTGVATVEGLHPGAFIYAVEHHDHERMDGTDSLAGAGRVERAVRLKRAALLAIQGESHWDDGAPAASVFVYSWCPRAGFFQTRSDGQGRFSVTVCGEGELRLTAGRRALPLEDVERALRDAGTRVALPTNGLVRLTLHRGGGFLHGVVRGPDGALLEDAEVEARAETTGERVIRFTDRDGRFSVYDVPREPHRIRVSFPYLPPAERTVGVDDSRPLEIVMATEARASGRLLDDRGRAVPHARILIRGNDGEFAETATDWDGQFDLRGLRGGTYTVHARAGDRDQLVLTGLRLPPGEHLNDLTLEVKGVPVTGQGNAAR